MEENKGTILIIDDDESVLNALRELLIDAGYTVYTSSSSFGVTARAIEVSPDVIVLDYNIPGLSGQGIASVLQDNDALRNTPIILYSGADRDELDQVAEQIDAAAVVPKGTNPSQLRAQIASLVLRQQTGEFDDP